MQQTLLPGEERDRVLDHGLSSHSNFKEFGDTESSNLNPDSYEQGRISSHRNTSWEIGVSGEYMVLDFWEVLRIRRDIAFDDQTLS